MRSRIARASALAVTIGAVIFAIWLVNVLSNLDGRAPITDESEALGVLDVAATGQSLDDRALYFRSRWSPPAYESSKAESEGKRPNRHAVLTTAASGLLGQGCRSTALRID